VRHKISLTSKRNNHIAIRLHNVAQLKSRRARKLPQGRLKKSEAGQKLQQKQAHEAEAGADHGVLRHRLRETMLGWVDKEAEASAAAIRPGAGLAVA
jgi:hypothetical protein